MILIFVFIGVVVYGLNYVQNYNAEQNEQANSVESEEYINKCVALGCPFNTKYIGDKNSKKYYRCDCRIAYDIEDEDIYCFENDEEAINSDFVKSKC